MVIDMLEKCKERKKVIENAFYKMIEYSDDIPTLEKLSAEMIAIELMVIRMEKQRFDMMYSNEREIVG